MNGFLHSMKKRTLILAVCGLLLFISPAAAQQETPADLPIPQIVAVAGTFQPALGCPGQWNTDCEDTFLALDGEDLLWRATWTIPAGAHEYKVALNGTWGDNFGLNAEYYGPNIPLQLDQETAVTFFYSHETHWITDNVNSLIANVPGSFQDEIGCPADWMPSCLRSWLQDPDGDGIYSWTTTWIPAGSYEAKVAVDESWDENYGAEGAPDGANIPFSVGQSEQVTFRWDPQSKLLSIETAPAPPDSETSPPVYEIPTEKPQPNTVTIPGTIQTQLGCPGDWQPECASTFLAFDEEDAVWQNEWILAAGEYEYKVALNGTWDINFGLNAEPGGANIPLRVAAEGPVKFYYDHQTGWVTDNVNSLIAVATGDFQSELGCAADGDPACLRSWLQDPNGDGIYTALLAGLPAGEYRARVALNEIEDFVTEEITFPVEEDGEVFLQFDPAEKELKIRPGAARGDLTRQQAHWVAAGTILWEIDAGEASTFQLVYLPDGGLEISPDGIDGGTALALRLDPRGPSVQIASKFPHLSRLAALTLDPDDLAKVPEILRGQFAVVAFDAEGRPLDATGLQIPGVLDDLYTYEGPLGLTWDGGRPAFRLWAPTARTVRLNLYDGAGPNAAVQSFDMVRQDETGVWSLEGQANWKGSYYLYEVNVFVPGTLSFESNLVTDPYSLGLSTNGIRSLVVDLDDPALIPAGWEDLAKLPLAAPEDIVIYELHVRDFSVNDPGVPEELRGTFLAFTLGDTNGIRHLRTLAGAGLTHLHLLPVFDMASVNEDKATWINLDFAALAALPPDSEEQQAMVMEVKGSDPFNWGYDPVHFGVPDGAYATDPEGAARILEFRQMVMALNQLGLRVVMDVVYNHTTASGQRTNSVLDRIVPGYYHRLNASGRVERSTCCENTASEHNMMRKLMVDMSLRWATDYRVDGFRFDLMGHHMVADMIAVRDALQRLTLETDGVDGSQIYLYGEGWDFGEVAGGARGMNASQINAAGTGIGTFNDRVRDAVRGGSAFGGHLEQGWATGLFTDPNETSAAPAVAKSRLLLAADHIRLALAGNLANYRFIDAAGNEVRGAQVDYNGFPAGYTLDPQEHVVYISAHDNETWFDAVQYKAPGSAAPADRVRMHNLGVSVVGFSQGVPFFHAGIDMLRSKSLDRDSFNSGDWFNRLDFSYQDNAWGSGLPVADKNAENWEIMAPLLGNPDLAVSSQDILAAVSHFQEVLRIRKSSPLFRLQTAEQVIERVRFHNTGPDQAPGLIVMSISDTTGADLDPDLDGLVVLFNAAPEQVTFSSEEFAGVAHRLHPVQAASHDTVVQAAAFDPGSGTFRIPGRTTAVFLAETAEADLATLLTPAVTTAPATEPPAAAASATPTPEPESVLTGNALAILSGAVLLLLLFGAVAIRRRWSRS